ncbi:MAG: hypothetical protein WBV39_00855, partial [Rudaea sp.]
MADARILFRPRSAPAATLLPSGQVLVGGGLGSSGVLASVELFDPGLAPAAAERRVVDLLGRASPARLTASSSGSPGDASGAAM